MIIECPACTSRYRIREDKLPSEGGNIKCPNCAHIFFVPRADARAASVSGSVPVIPSDPVPALDPAPESGSSSDTGSSEGKRWKLKNPVGLVYDFPDTEQIRNWLVSRESFDGIQVSADAGVTWRGIREEPDLADVKATGTKIMSMPQTASLRNTGPGTTQRITAKTVDQLKSEAEARLREARRTREENGSERVQYKLIKPPATKQAEQTGRLLLALAVFVLPLLALVGLHNSGVINLRDIDLFEEPNPEGPVGVALPDRGYLPAEVEEVEPPTASITTEQAVAALINQAGAAQARGENAQAILHLENAISLVPEDTELSCLLAPIYEAEQRSGDSGLAAERCAAGREEEGYGAEGSGVEAPTEGTPAAQEGSGDPAEQSP